MLNFPGSLADMSVLEKQQLRLSLSLSLLKQQHQYQPKCFDFNAMPQFQGLVLHNNNGGFHPDLSGFPVLSTEFHHGHGPPEMTTSSLEMDQSVVSGTSNYAPLPVTKEEEGMVGNENIKESNISVKKRKAESEESRGKKRNGGDAGEDQNQKESTDYVHVRARRGQATDSHSLAERARREKINKKMKCLQELVPGCNKPTGKAGMLDEIINYVQSLQRQVEFLSMKLAHVNPGQQLSIDSIFSKEFPSCVASTLSEMANLAYNQTNSAQPPVGTSCELDMLMPLSPQQTAPPRISSSPVSQVQSFSNWEMDLQKLYNANAGFQ